jgi:C-terminal processing protease CtpA/Prc
LNKRLAVVYAAALLAVACTNTTPSPTATPAPSANPTPTPSAATTAAPSGTPEPSVNPTSPPTGDQPQIVTGQVAYTNVFFTAGAAEPLIILEDQGGFVTRDRNFEISEQSQVIGQITSDFYHSPFSYSLTLPSEPRGSLHDVDHDGQTDQGVQVFAVAYWTNIWGDPYLELRDQGGGGWSSAYASTKVSDAADSYLEVYGGKYLVYAPDATEQFPSGFGTDKKLFTDDDPLIPISQGWSVIDMDQTPFAVSRDAGPVIDLYEPESASLDDFSAQTYSQAFDSMLEKFRHEYAWTELKGIDWDAEATQFRPAFVAAEATHDPHAYALALRDFLWSIPDTHVGFDQSLLNDDFANETAGGVGFSMIETDDGKYLVDYVTAGGPAASAGINFGAEILSLDGQPTADAVSAAVPWSSPFSNPQTKRLQQLRYALRFPLSKGSVNVTFKNRGGAEGSSSVAVVQENDSFRHSSTFFGQPDFALPVEFAVLPTDPAVGYIQINSFFDNQVLTIQLWERAVKYLNDNGIGSVILDLRHNGGGSGWLADQMAAYFFDHRVAVGNVARYDPTSDSFYADPTDLDEMIPPRPELQYSGKVAVLIGPACASACEFFSYNMTLENRAAIVGQYSTEGAGGSVQQFLMPEGIPVQLTIGRAVDANGQVHIEGTGVAPTVKVPVTFETIQADANGSDPVLSAAETLLAP